MSRDQFLELGIGEFINMAEIGEIFEYLQSKAEVTRRHLKIVSAYRPQKLKAFLHLCRADGEVKREKSVSNRVGRDCDTFSDCVACDLFNIVAGDHYSMLSRKNSKAL